MRPLNQINPRFNSLIYQSNWLIQYKYENSGLVVNKACSFFNFPNLNFILFFIKFLLIH